MVKNKLKQLGESPPGNYDYNGMFKEQQLYGSSHHGIRYGTLVHTMFNNYQNFLYNRALFGLSVYSQEDIKQMHWDKRKRIIKVHKRAQQTLNLWKQEINNLRISKLFNTLFPRSTITPLMTEDYVDPSYVCKMTFKDLGITKDYITQKLILEGILPKDFYELKAEQLCLETSGVR
jgi:hypothetical protein